MSRCRLRFLLHEFDLSLGVTTIGRDVDCHITLDDPLVSRRHARIIKGTDRVVIEDTKSRNGVFVNGASVRKLAQLRDGDRVRIGAQAFVFCEQTFAAASPIQKSTGESHTCANCRLPCSRQLKLCPACAEREAIDEDTLSGYGEPNRPGLPLLVEALEEALELGRIDDARRILQRTSAQIEQLVAVGGSEGLALLAALATKASELTAQSQAWALDVHRDTPRVFSIDYGKEANPEPYEVE
jgi:predicted component of type VI protein secretion system